MTYDYNQADVHSQSGFNAPLNSDPSDPTTLSDSFVAAGVASFLEAKVPANKIVLGMPFYGRGWTGCSTANHGLYQTCSSASTGTWVSGVLDIADIEQNYLNSPDYTRYWDDNSDSPWLFDEKNGTFITYDDVESLSYKTAFIQQKALAGAMFWDITSDTHHTLLNKLARDLLGK